MAGSPIPVPVISAAGITLPSYNDVLLGYQQGYASVYGVDASIQPDDIDGQWIAIQAQAYFDLCQMIGVMYNMWGVLNTSGPMLDNICALTNTQRQAPTNSTAIVTVSGTAYTLISNGVIGDNQNLGTTWDLPASVTIPSGGTIQVTATCTTAGAVSAQASSLTNILTPTGGWTAVTNPAPAIPGTAVETDAQLVQQQQLSVSSGAITPIEAIAAAVANVPGVSSVAYFNNDTGLPVNGVPAGNFALIVAGGDSNAVAAAIAAKKPPGIPSFGNVAVVVFDAQGTPDTINWFEVSLVQLNIQITISPKAGYQAQTGADIQKSVAAFINAFIAGQSSYLNDLYGPAKLNNTYTVTNIQQGVAGGGLAPSDLNPLIYQQFHTTAAHVTILT
jgi:uncharacterized phage protein gp47/JayE